MTTTQRDIHVFGIESSCDDTGVAILNQRGNVLSNCFDSQLRKHLRNGGIVPVIAKDYHLESIDRVARRAFEQSKLKSFEQNVDMIAVCNRPGMEFSLKVGLNYAKTLAKKYSKPLIPIHHMQAHALMALLQNPSIRFPFIALLLSGGHCLLSIVERVNKFHLLGHSLDDAPGDLLDKIGRRLRFKNLGDPFDRISGGAAVELLAKQPGSDPFRYYTGDRSVPMLQVQSCDFSFSGYRGYFEDLEEKFDNMWVSGDQDRLKQELGHLCASLQRVMLVQIAKKLQRAILFYNMHWRLRNPQAFEGDDHLGFGILDSSTGDAVRTGNGIDVVISGGVAANSFFVESLRTFCTESFNPPSSVYAPSRDLCSDNGLMIAWNGLLRYRAFEGGEGHRDADTSVNESIVHDESELDLVEVASSSPIGVDIGVQVRSANFSLPKIEQLLFRVVR